MNHLGREVSALVDGQLPPERAERALVHLVGCARCSAEVAAERASRRALSESGPVEPSAGLTERLLSVPAAPAVPQGGARGWARRAAEPLQDHRVRHRLVTSSSLALVGAATVVGALVVVGALAERSRDPATMLAEVRAQPQQGSTQRLAFSPDGVSEAPPAALPDVTSQDAVLAWMEENGWSAPTHVPGAVHFSRVRLAAEDGAPVLEVELVGGGHHVRIIEQQGQLDPELLDQLEPVEVAGRPAHRLPGAEVRLLVQCADNAVMVVANSDLAFDVAAGLPAEPYDDGVLGRLDRGWGTLVTWTGALTDER